MTPINNVPEGHGRDERSVIDSLLKIPHKIIRHHEVEGLVQLVMHEIAHHSLFGLRRALYLIDNPDFDHLKGVAGFCEKECHHHGEDLWERPHGFHEDMSSALFHRQVKEYLGNSFRLKHLNVHDFDQVTNFGESLGIRDPHFFTWEMKYGNHGLFIFENNNNLGVREHNLLSHAAALLSLCGH